MTRSISHKKNGCPLVIADFCHVTASLRSIRPRRVSPKIRCRCFYSSTVSGDAAPPNKFIRLRSTGFERWIV